MKKTIFGILLALVMSLSCVLCACAPADDKKPDESDDPTPPPVTAATITGFDSFVAKPKTNYLPGEKFDIKGLIVKVNMSDNTTKTLFDTEFKNWTHKDEALTEDVENIVIDIPNTDPVITCTLPITVEIPADTKIQVDTSALSDYYVMNEAFDLASALTIRYTSGGVVTTLNSVDDVTYTYGDENTEIADPTNVTIAAAGTYTVTVHYTLYTQTYTDHFDIEVKDPSELIVPAYIEAEDCAYIYDAPQGTTAAVYDTEHEAKAKKYEGQEGNMVGGTNVQPSTFVSTYPNGSLSQTIKLNTGASGRGSLAYLDYVSLDGSKGKIYDYTKWIFFKFTVTVPQAGTYVLRSRATGITNAEKDLDGKFLININGKQKSSVPEGEDGFEYVPAVGTGKVQPGNQVAEYTEVEHYESNFGTYGSPWTDTFWWTTFEICKVELQEGENTIRLRMTNGGVSANVDSFEIVTEEAAQQTGTVSLFHIRNASGARAKLDNDKNVLYLEKGKKLENIAGYPSCPADTPDGYPLKYTLIYMVLADGTNVPVCTKWLSEIDYDHVGEQTVTVTITKKDGSEVGTAQFKLVITEAADD